jgi:hypothetical protein
MTLEIEYGENSFVVELDDRFSSALHGKLPFTTELNVWKEEIYFLTPIKIDTSGMNGQLRVEPGRLYYWPPEGGFCIFHGVSQPYSQVYLIGSYIGVLSMLKSVGDGVEATVEHHKIYEPYLDIVSVIESLGYKVSTPMRGGERAIETSKFIDGRRVAFRLYREEYGVHIECEPIFPRDHSPSTLRLIANLSRLIDQGGHARLDLSEDGWITVTGFVERNLSSLPNAINEVSYAYLRIVEKILAEEK